jgi:hypothetical protein
MKTIKFLSFALILTVGMILIIQGCQKENVESIDSISNKVTLNYAKQIALNFTKDDAFIRDSLKQILKVELRSTKQNKNPFPGFEEREIHEIITFNDDDGEIALYVIKFLPNGYVIVPSTTKETPILAFSNDGVFDEINIPEGVLDWINLRTKVVDGLIDDENYEVPSEITEQWLCLAPPIDDEEIISGGEVNEQVGPLITTRWGQGHGYNWLCPQYGCNQNDGRALTGCVATAMAQIIKDWNYPNNYNYSIMPNQIGAFDPITNNTTEVAKLMRDCGVAVNMNYGCNSSGATATPMINALKNTFHFSSGMQYIDFNLNKAIEQFEVFGWPIIMTGYDVNGLGGHAWVSDGYRRIRYVTIHNPGTYYEYETYTFSDNYLHMNWGWNDSFNTNSNWFFNGVPNVGWANFSNQQKMLIYIHP